MGQYTAWIWLLGPRPQHHIPPPREAELLRKEDKMKRSSYTKASFLDSGMSADLSRLSFQVLGSSRDSRWTLYKLGKTSKQNSQLQPKILQHRSTALITHTKDKLAVQLQYRGHIVLISLAMTWKRDGSASQFSRLVPHTTLLR
jgi:hypothetical protein